MATKGGEFCTNLVALKGPNRITFSDFRFLKLQEGTTIGARKNGGGAGPANQTSIGEVRFS